MSSPISWLWRDGFQGESWNFVTGCSKVSEGCRNCYAERLSISNGWSKLPWTNPNTPMNIEFHHARLQKPYHWQKATMCFVNSMSDVFHPTVPDELISSAFKVMNDLQQHLFLILTKRPKRAAEWAGPWSPNIWMGTSVEDSGVVDRIDDLRQCRAVTRFVSFEPLIAPVGRVNFYGIHWAIVGGESGPGFRPMDHSWAREIRDQAKEAGLPFFFKQSAALKPEVEPYLLEADGSYCEWREWPELSQMQHAGPQQLSLLDLIVDQEQVTNWLERQKG